jgi:hypothetical protein
MFDQLIKSAVDKSEAPSITQKPTPIIEAPANVVSSDEPIISVPEVQIQPSPPVTLDEKEDALFKNFLSNIDTVSMNISEDDIKILQKRMSNIVKSHLGVVRECCPETCSHVNTEQGTGLCPFAGLAKYPRGKNCPLEIALANHTAEEYYNLIEIENGSNSFTVMEHQTVRDLVEVELEEFRTRSYLNSTGSLIQYAAFAVKETGEIIYNMTKNPIYDVMDRTSRRKDKLMQRLLLTPEAKARFKIKDKRTNRDSTKDILSRLNTKLDKLANPNG